ncbi:MAG: amino acid decarboxylase [Planctomycetes bacterium]|nr:amino acid decarboxylase [Planctomycetota bacterium]
MDAVHPRLVAWLESLPDQPSHATDGATDRLSGFREALPERPGGLEPLLDRLFGDVIPFSFNTAGPGYLAFVPGGGLPSACIAELVASVTNRYAGVWAAAPVAVEIETQVLRWLCELCGMPDGSLGILTTGASMSNFIAAITAREAKLGPDLTGAVAYVPTEIHHCMTKALRIAGIPPDGIRAVPVDERFRVRVDSLQRMIADDRTQDRRPFMVCASAGTVNTGAVDPLDAIADLAEAEDLWFHIDGAYGATFYMVEELQPPLAGMPRADSLSLDPHKGLFLPYGTGALLVKDLAALRAAHAADAAYLPPLNEGHQQIDFCNLSPELSRDWRGLRLWLPFHLHGVQAFRDALREKHQLAIQAADALAQVPDVELAHAPELSLFAFRQRLPGRPLAEENAHNRDLIARINATRRIMLTGTEIDGTYWLRICVLHLRTHQDRMDEAIDIIRGCLAGPGPGRG